MSINLKKLSKIQLDKLISEAIQLRAKMGHPATDPTKDGTIDTISQLNWRAEYQVGKTLLCLWFPGIGWRGFFFSPEERATLTAALTVHTENALAKGEADRDAVSAASAITSKRDKKGH